MADGKHCPACGKDIGAWAVFSAGLPNRIWCPHCSARLGYREAIGVYLLLAAALVALVVGAFFASFLWEAVSPLVFGGVLLLVWVPVDLAATMFLRGNRQLVRLDAPPKGENRVGR